jgi:hypothetical protein
MGGGRGNPIWISTAAIAPTGKILINAKRIVPKTNLFILLPPVLIKKWPLSSTKRFFSL